MENETKVKPATAKYIAEEPLTHNGAEFAVGDEVELTEKEAKPLLANGSVAEPSNVSLAAKEAPKARKKEADERESAAARRDYDRAQADSADADAALKEATTKAEEAKRKADVAKARLAKMKPVKGEGAHTWEQDADKLGSGQLTAAGAPGSSTGTPAKAPAQGSAMTPSSPTAEAVKNQ